MSAGSSQLAMQGQAGSEAKALSVLRLFGQGAAVFDRVSEAFDAAQQTERTTARAFVYGPETASLFETASEIVYPTDGGIALQPQVREGWRTYNFEVEEFHTYIAGGMRVHNTSILNLIPEGASDILLSDPESDEQFHTASYDLPNGVRETIHGRDLNDDGHTDLVDRITEVPGAARLGIESRITWTEKYNGDNTTPYETKVTGIDYPAGSLQGEEIGRTLGSALGSAIGGGNIFAQVGSATIASTVLQNIGEFLQKNIDFSILEKQGLPVNALEAATNDAFHDFGYDLAGNLKIQVNNVLSGILIGEIADALNLDGFERGVFTTVGNTVTNQFLANIAGAITNTLPPETVVSANLNLLNGFEYTSMVSNVVNSLGGYFGTQLGNLAVAPQNQQAALFGSAAAAVGSYVGGTALATALSAIPVIGTLIGAFAGQALGNLIGNAFFDDDRIARYTLYTDENGIVQYGYPYTHDGASLALSQYIASTTSQSINSVYQSADARIDVNHTFNPFTVGWYVNHENQKIMYSVDEGYKANYDIAGTQGIIAAAVNYAVANSEMGGNDLILRRAYEVSHDDGLVQLGFDLQVAKDYHKYLANTQLINTLIADEPTSAFAAGWIATLQRAQELSLNTLSSFDGLEYIASNRDLIPYIGYNRYEAERHYIKYGIGEGRRETFDAYEYLAANPGLAQALGGLNRDTATIHYMDYGYAEGRPTTFDYLQYLAVNPNLAQALGGIDSIKAKRHYIEYGYRENRPTIFDAYSYVASYSDVGFSFGLDRDRAEIDLIENGFRPITFDAQGYINRNPDILAAFGSNTVAAAKHYIQTGRTDGFHKGVFTGGANGSTIEGGSGSDTVSYENSSVGIVIDLAARQTFNGSNGDLLVSIENAIGSRHNDAFVSGVIAGRLEGYDGDDKFVAAANGSTLNGGGGSDTVSYENSSVGIVIDLAARQTFNGSNGDLLVSIENAIGSRHNDAFVSGVIAGRLEGYDGDDKFVAAANGSTLNGGGGSDTVSYENSSVGIVIDLAARQTFNGSNGDLLVSIENAIGSRHNDALYGDGGNNIIIGGASGDSLFGGAGADTFRYMTSSDSTYAGYDLIHDFQTGTDLIDVRDLYVTNVNIVHYQGASYVYATSSNDSFQLAALADINGSDLQGLSNGVYLGGEAGNETLIGSAFNDTIDGFSGNDEIYAGDGNDIIIGGGNGDNLFGGPGADTFRFTSVNDSTVTAYDFIKDFEHGVDRIDLSALRTGGPDSIGIDNLNGGSYLYVDLGGDGTNDLLILFTTPDLKSTDVFF